MDICKTHNLYIANGRLGNEKLVGKFTCKDCGVVGYVIGTRHVFKITKHFQVFDYDPLYSDVHCDLYISIDINKQVDDNDYLINIAHPTKNKKKVNGNMKNVKNSLIK